MSQGRYRAYPRYKESGVEWIGRVPASWETTFLKHYLAISPCYGILKPDKYAGDDGVRIVRILDVSNRLVDLENLETVSPRLSDEYRRTLIKPGDLVVSVVGTLGRSFICKTEHEGMNLSRALARVQLRDPRLAKFVQYLIDSQCFEDFVQVTCTGAAQRVLNMEDLCNWAIPCAEIGTLTQIAAFLDHETAKIDRLIEKQEALIRLLKEKRQAVISHAVTKGLNPHAPLKDSGIPWLGQVPAHWAIRPLATVAAFSPGKAHEPFIDDNGKYVCVNSRFVSTGGESRKFCTHNITPAAPNDVLMVMSDLPNGRALAKAYFVTHETDLAVNQRVCAITAIDGAPRFLYYFLDRNAGFLLHDDGVSQTHLSNADFTKLPTLVPPKEEQHSIADFLDQTTRKIDELISKAELAVEVMQERRTALISAAVTGKIDVRDWQPPSTER